MRNLQSLFSDVKCFMGDEVYKTFLLTALLILGLGIWMHLEIKSLKIEIEKKIDYRYFNLTRSLENINDIKIDTKTGEIKH